MSDIRVLAFDTETAGLKGGVCELAVVEIDEDLTILNQIESLIDPEIPISAGAGGIHGIRDDDVADKPTLRQFTEVYGNPFDHPDLVVLGHNVRFDCRVCADILPERYRKMCTLKLARKLYPDMDNHQLQTLAYAFRLEKGDAHRAMSDVMTTIYLVRHMMADEGLTFAELFELSQDPITPNSKLGFGVKHKDDKIKDVPTSYLRWMLSNVTDLDPELEAVIRSQV